MEIDKFNINKIPVYFYKTSKFKTISVEIDLLNTYSKENATKLSLLIRLLETSTKLYNTKKEMVNKLYDLYDATVSAMTYPNYKTSITTFSLEVVNDIYLTEKGVLDQAFNFLYEIIFNPNIIEDEFSHKEFNEEKRLLKESIENVYNNKGRYAGRRLVEEMFPNEIASVYSLGSLEELEKLTPKVMADFYKYLLDSSNICFYVVGDIEKDKIKSCLERLPFKQNDLKQYLSVCDEEHKVTEVKVVKEKRNINQSIVTLGFRTNFTNFSSNYYAGIVFNEMFGGSYTSDLNLVVREKNSMAYNIYSQIIPDVKFLAVQAGISSKNYQKVVDLVNQTLENFRKGEFDLKQFDYIVASIINPISSLSDDAKEVITFMRGNLLRQKDRKISDVIDEYKKVTKNDIIEIAKGISLDTIFLLTDK